MRLVCNTRRRPLAGLLWQALTVSLLAGTLHAASALPVRRGRAVTEPVIGGDLGSLAVFPANNAWNTDISSAPVDVNSATLINSIGLTTSLHPDFGTTWGIPYVTVPGTQPKVPVNFDYSGESDPGPYPIPATAPIEGGPTSTDDRHVLVVDRDNAKLYETWSSYPNADGSWHCGSGAIFDLASNAVRPDGWTSADAAGLPILPGLVRYEEAVTKGVIAHALRFTVQHSRASYIYPARHYASNSTDPSLPPMGLRVRLKASVDISSYPPVARVVLTALKKYGMIVADNGGNWFLSGAPDSRWDDNAINTLKGIHGSDFEVIVSPAEPTASVPAAPASLVATAGNAQVGLSWGASAGATGYYVKRSTVSGSGFVAVASGLTGTSFTDTTVSNGTVYYYVVTAVNAAGESAPSNQAAAFPAPSVPSAPAGLAATPGVGQVSLAWSASTGATSYAVKRATVHGGPYGTLTSSLTSTGYTDSGLTPGTTYYYLVTAINSGGESPASSEASATPTASTVPPTQLIISGMVSANGKPVSGATVAIWSAHIATTTGADGTYALGYFTAGTYAVSAFGGGYSFPDASVTLTTASATGVNFTYGATATTYSISGAVTAAGVGLPGVAVSAGGQSAVTGATGAYTLSGLAAGAYSVGASLAGYTLSAAQSVTIGPNASGINFTATPIAPTTYSISGTVTAGSTGLAGATVTAGSASATTAPDGSYTLSGLAAGTYSVSAGKSGYTMSTARSVTLGPNATGVSFTATAVVVTGTNFTISGTARVNGVPIGGITVAVFGTGIATTTAADGTYTLGYFGSGTYSITAFGKGYSFNSPTVTVGPSQSGIDLTSK